MPMLDWKRIHEEATVVDLHIHPSMQQQLFQRKLGLRYTINRTFHGDPFSVRASFPRLKSGGYGVILSVLFVPEPGLRRDFPILNLLGLLKPSLWKKLILSQPFEALLQVMDDMEKAVSESTAKARMQMACSVSQLDTLLSIPKADRPIAVIHAVEGGHSLGLKKDVSDDDILKHVETIYQRGVAYLTLAHFYPNRLVHPCYPFPEDITHLSIHPTLWRDLTQGLTPLGVKVVERMIELGMAIDLSHSSPAARQQVYDLIDASGKRVPLLVTHVGAYGLNPSPYNLTDWEIRRIARDGGVIGVIFMPYWLMPKDSLQGINAISQHIRYLIDVGGSDVVGLGTDFDGFTTPPDDLDNAAFMPRLTQRLVVDGYDEQQILKILGDNALRALREGWGRR